MTYRRAAGLGAVSGSAFAVGITLIIAARAAYEITRTHRWYQLKQL